MADSKSKLDSARRLLKELQKKKKENANAVTVADDKSLPSSQVSSFTSELNSPNGISQNPGNASSTTSSPINAFHDIPSRPINGNHTPTIPAFAVEKDGVTKSASSFFDNLPPVPMSSSIDNISKPPATNTPPPYSFLTINDRTDSSSSVSTRSDDETTRRLVSLETQLGAEIERKEELEYRLNESREKTTFLENEVRRLRNVVDHLSNDRTPHDEKLAMQSKTIEILVSEKSELQQELAALSEESKINSERCMEYSVKMKALKSEVARLQTEARDNNEARQQHNSILKKLEHSLNESSSLIDQYRKDIEMNHDEIHELKRIILENDSRTEALKAELEETKRKLSLAEMKIAQSGGSLEEALEPSPYDFEKECEVLKEEMVRMRKEVAENTAQYKDYIETLNSQLHRINEQYETCLAEKNKLLAYQESLTKQLGDMEKQITKERQSGPSLSQFNSQLNEQLATVTKELEVTRAQLEEKTKQNDELTSQLQATTAKLHESESALEQLEIPDSKLLQAAMESDRVAASRAIAQNTHLKAQIQDLEKEMHHSIIKLNNEKLDLTEKLQHSEHLVKELSCKLEKYDHRKDIVYTDSVAQCPMIFQKDHSVQTDVDDLDIIVDPEHATPEAMKLLEEKLKKTMLQVADLTDEKQRLEHIVLQLQGETETICEYVTLYQSQRGLLREKVLERERQLNLLEKERKELKEKLKQINQLLPQVSTTIGLQTADISDDELAPVDDAASRIKTLLTEIESSNFVQDKLGNTPSTFHPCLLCSGKLITV
ncbi:golgin subfamily A [Nesidiocoris tenuis]|uniref:Golgin subfamily A n=1 Tax=Nesidiocoris tenuis TaxID=355587 RepID=A0ABN7ACR0_9HEMI|nr:golgin subfamily A [Nesidiocoris tenuis]